MPESIALSSYPQRPQLSVDSASMADGKKSYYRQLVDWTVKYKYPMMGCHFAFLSLSSGIVGAIAILVLVQKKTEEGITFSQQSLWMVAVFSLLSVFLWGYPAILCIAPKLSAAHERMLDRIGFTQKARFWVWFLLINSISFALWCVITTLYWDITWVCWIGHKEGAELNPFESNVCDQLTNIWFYAIFNAAAILANLFLVVDEQLNFEVAIGRDVEKVMERNSAAAVSWYADTTASDMEKKPIVE
ncbi:hypothetical protein BC830DRAFT_196862 [Chytriomyces sp. MP71]|nr:hypothetical protein BC830DRAFT_196862 [Chytriomyces sp. MP71]